MTLGPFHPGVVPSRWVLEETKWRRGDPAKTGTGKVTLFVKVTLPRRPRVCIEEFLIKGIHVASRDARCPPLPTGVLPAKVEGWRAGPSSAGARPGEPVPVSPAPATRHASTHVVCREPCRDPAGLFL